MVLPAVPTNDYDYTNNIREEINLRAKKRNTLADIDTYAKYLKSLNQQIGIRMKAAIAIKSGLLSQYSSSVSKHTTWSI